MPTVNHTSTATTTNNPCSCCCINFGCGKPKSYPTSLDFVASVASSCTDVSVAAGSATPDPGRGHPTCAELLAAGCDLWRQVCGCSYIWSVADEDIPACGPYIAGVALACLDSIADLAPYLPVPPADCPHLAREKCIWSAFIVVERIGSKQVPPPCAVAEGDPPKHAVQSCDDCTWHCVDGAGDPVCCPTCPPCYGCSPCRPDLECCGGGGCIACLMPDCLDIPCDKCYKLLASDKPIPAGCDNHCGGPPGGTFKRVYQFWLTGCDGNPLNLRGCNPTSCPPDDANTGDFFIHLGCDEGLYVQFACPTAAEREEGVGTAVGDSTASATGAADAAAVGTAAGDSSAAASSGTDGQGAGSAAGDSTASATGAADAAGVGTAAGSSSAAATGAADDRGVGSAAGDSSAAATGAADANAVGTAAGDSSATATGSACGPVTVTITATGDETWTVPADADPAVPILVECWGGGEDGTAGLPNSIANPGGKPGQGGIGSDYAADTVTGFTPGTTVYSLHVGAHGAPGEDTWFDTTGTVLARGGASVTGASLGAVKHFGGLGGAKLSGVVGGCSGGNGGTPTADGTAGNVSTTSSGASPPAGQTDGGQGGRGGDSTGNAGLTAGAQPGGGGAGGGTPASGTNPGSAGGNGQIRITYTGCS